MFNKLLQKIIILICLGIMCAANVKAATYDITFDRYAIAGATSNISSANVSSVLSVYSLTASDRYNAKIIGFTLIAADEFKDDVNLLSLDAASISNSIGGNAFNGCINLATIKLGNQPPVLASTAFDGIDLSYITLYIPAGSRSVYEEHSGWGKAYIGNRLELFADVIEYFVPPATLEPYIVLGSLPTDGQLIDDGTNGSKTMENGYKVSFANVSDASKQYRFVYEIKNSKGRTIWKKEEVVCKNDLKGGTEFTKNYNLRPSGNGQGTIILTIKDMKGKVIATDSRTFEVEGIPPRIISVKKKK